MFFSFPISIIVKYFVLRRLHCQLSKCQSYLKNWVGRKTQSKSNKLHSSLHMLWCNAKLFLFSAANYVFMKHKSTLISLLLLSHSTNSIFPTYFFSQLNIKKFSLNNAFNISPLSVFLLLAERLYPHKFSSFSPPLLNVLIRSVLWREFIKTVSNNTW